MMVTMRKLLPMKEIIAMDGTRNESVKDPTWFIPPIVVPGLLIALLIATVAYHAYS
jgi:hypothetical protein